MTSARSAATRARRRAFLDDLRHLEGTLEAAKLLDRVAGHVRDRQVAEALHARAEACREVARWARSHLGGQVRCPTPAFETARWFGRALLS